MATLEVSLNQSTDKGAPLDCESWMTDLPPTIRKLPLIQLAIPGSHDSMTYAIKSTSRIAPDSDPWLQRIRFLGPILTGFMSKWCKTQDLAPIEQLKSGIRYFDLRIAVREKSEKLYFVHGLYASEVFGVLEHIRSFLETHPKEVVILDCQHFYAFQLSDHHQLMSQLTTFFGSRLLPFRFNMDDVSLDSMTRGGQQVIVIYRSDAARFGQPNLWPSACFPTPWADTDSVPALISFLIERLKYRTADLGYVSQCLLTPTKAFIMSRFFRSLKTACFIPLEGAKYQWLKEQRPGWRGVNIIISDFVGYENGAFAKAVIDLNRKLIEPENRDKMTPIDGGH